MSVSKVVKVEEIDNGAVGLSLSALVPGTDRSKTDQTGSTLLAYGTDSSLLPTRGLYNAKPSILSFSQTRLINSIIHEYSCKILCLHFYCNPVI